MPVPEPLVTSADFPDVRLLIDPTLSSTDLPDSLLTLLLPAARRWLLAEDPDAESRTGDELAAAKLAEEYWLAALAAPRLQRRVEVRFREANTERQYSTGTVVSGADLAADLRGLAEAELASYLESDGEVDVPVLFTTACGGRGR